LLLWAALWKTATDSTEVPSLVPWCGRAAADRVREAERGKALPSAMLLLSASSDQEDSLSGARAPGSVCPAPPASLRVGADGVLRVHSSRQQIRSCPILFFKEAHRDQRRNATKATFKGQRNRLERRPAPVPTSPQRGRECHARAPSLPTSCSPLCHPQAASAPGTLCSYLRLNAHFSSSLSQLGLDQSWEVVYVCRNGKEMNAASPLKSVIGE